MMGGDAACGVPMPACEGRLLAVEADRGAAAAGGLCVLALDAQAPVVAQTTVGPGDEDMEARSGTKGKRHARSSGAPAT